MAKKTKKSDLSPLSQFWTPPAGVVEGGAGAPWACLASTFEFNAAFFETELLPRFLGLKFDHTENEPSFLVEREEALALAHVCVLPDHTRFDSSQTTLRWDQLQIQIPGGVQHAKITVLAWENLIRVIIGSANLTRTGYRKNREVFAALDFWDGAESAPRSLLSDVLDLLTVMLGWSRSAESSLQRARDTLARLRSRSRRWKEAPEEFTVRERPRVSIAVTHPAATGHPARATLDEVRQLWGNRRATSIVVVSPFTAPEPDAEIGDVVVKKLAEIPMTRDCDGWLIAPELPRTPEDDRTRLPFPHVFGQSWKRLFADRGGASVLSLPLCVEGKEDRNRTLHSKSLVIENEKADVALMMIGSSNFTPRGMGVGHRNFEANLVFEDSGNVKRDGLRLIDRLGLPRDWEDAMSVDEIVWQSPEEPPEDEPDPQPVLPAFFQWATFSQVSGQLKLAVNRAIESPEKWAARLPGSAPDTFTVFSDNMDRPKDSPILTHVLPEPMRAANIVSLSIQWLDDAGESHFAKLAVTTEGEEHLLPPEQFQHLTAEAIIECLVSGKTPAQWGEGRITAGGPSKPDNASIESLRSIDTTSFLLYRIRLFGRALTGMSQRILRTLPHPAAMRYRLLKDPFGPIALADSIMQESEVDDDGWCKELDDEHRLFLLAEILLVVVHLENRVKRTAKGKERKAIEEVFRTTIEQLRSWVEGMTELDTLPVNLLAYVRNILDQIQPAGNSTEIDNVR